jgi:hypothetical protein
MKNRYRVIRDRFSGFEAQVRYWWFPFYWSQIDSCNTSATLEKAKWYIEAHKTLVVHSE